jgi:hypothetical protein
LTERRKKDIQASLVLHLTGNQHDVAYIFPICLSAFQTHFSNFKRSNDPISLKICQAVLRVILSVQEFAPVGSFFENNLLAEIMTACMIPELCEVSYSHAVQSVALH